jgi:ubiquinone/menaquinone biosynthesis C-methylase UbiE
MSNDTKKVISVWDKVAADFGKVGPNYWNLFGERLVELSSINSGARVLDIGMGRGASLFPAIKKAGAEGYVIGIDNSSVMVSETHKDIVLQKIYNSEVKVMSAENLDFADNSFDNIICGFAVGCLLYSENKLNGVKRVLKNRGQAGFSIWGIQEDQKWLTQIINKYLNIQPKKSDNSAILKFDNVQDVEKILQTSGFKNINLQEEKADVIYKDKEEWWQEMCTNAVRGIFESIEALGRDKFEMFKKEIFDGLEEFNKGDGYHFIMPVIYAFGEK